MDVCCGAGSLKDVVSIASGQDENIFVYVGPDVVSAVCPRIQNKRPASGHTRRRHLFYANFPGIFGLLLARNLGAASSPTANFQQRNDQHALRLEQPEGVLFRHYRAGTPQNGSGGWTTDTQLVPFHIRPIHLAGRYALPTTLRFLIQFQSDLNVTNCHDESALHLAARSSSSGCVQVLLKADAPVNIRDNNGQAPLQTAKHLLNYRVDVSSRDVMGNTPLHLLFMRSRIPDVNHRGLLIEYGADLNTQNTKGWTPLFFLIFGGKYIT